MQYDATREALYNPGNASDFFAQGRPKPTAALCAEMSRLSYCKTETTVAQCLNRAEFTDYKLYDKCGSQALLAYADDLTGWAYGVLKVATLLTFVWTR